MHDVLGRLVNVRLQACFWFLWKHCLFVCWLTLKCLYKHYSYEYAVSGRLLKSVSLQTYCWLYLCVMNALCVYDNLQVPRLLWLTPLWPPLPLLTPHRIPLVSLCSLPWLYDVNSYSFIFVDSDAVIIGNVVVVYHEYTMYWPIHWEEWYCYNSLVITSCIVNHCILSL